ncbi:hypothetical protein HDU96_008900 [Phlyctochytrium bullatum]|nr:hypothetical protein HDU96_008900 [Phlyctochytrium bullatum]
MLNPVRRAEAQYLRDAIASGDLYLCKRILHKKKLPLQSPNPENGWPLLFYAISYRQNEIVQYLLDSGHEVEQPSKDFEGNTALMVAAEYRNENAFQMYVRRYPQTIPWENKQGRSALIIATEKAMNAAIVTLLDMGADVNCVDGDGSTPLHHAAAWGHFETVAILIQRGANATLKNKRGWIPADYAYSIEMLEHLNECFVAVAENRPIRQPAPLGAMRSLMSVQSSSAMVVGGMGGVGGVGVGGVGSGGGILQAPMGVGGAGAASGVVMQPGMMGAGGSTNGSNGPKLDLRTFF